MTRRPAALKGTLKLEHQIKELGLEGELLVDFHKTHWCSTDDEVMWVDNEKEVYSGEYHSAWTDTTDNWRMFEVDSGCGYNVSSLFDKSMEIPREKFEEMYAC